MELHKCENCEIIMGKPGLCTKCAAGGNRPREEKGNIFFTTRVSDKYQPSHWVEHRAEKVQDVVRASDAPANTVTIRASGIVGGVDIPCQIPGGMPLTARVRVRLSAPRRHGELPTARFVKWIDEGAKWAQEHPALRLP